LYPGLRHEPLNEPEAPDVLDEIVAWLGARLTTAG
jgi:alpha-beta hydrolase superfamily lysophospholipase